MQKRPKSTVVVEMGRFLVEMPGVEPGSETTYSPSVYMRSPRIQGLGPLDVAREPGFRVGAG